MNSLIEDVSPYLPSSLVLTLILVTVFTSLSKLSPRIFERVFTAAEQALSQLARAKTFAICFLFCGVVVLRLALLPQLGVPTPGIHDEFSYLLMADTFAHGRLANPAHPMWPSFETFHVNMLPTYSSIYPPAQGFVLFLGQMLGHPWIGVVLSAAGMCSAIAWMLQAWMPARWAFLAGALAGLKLCIVTYWMNSYWGGAAAAIGGALVLGALGRILRGPRVPDALLLGLGIAILVNSRPYEGLLLCIPVAVVFCLWLAGKTEYAGNFKQRWKTVFLPFAAVIALTGLFMGYYNWRLTGDPFLFPRVVAIRAYHRAAMFIWENPKPPVQLRNSDLNAFYNNWERNLYKRSWYDFQRISSIKTSECDALFFWPGSCLVLAGLFFVDRDRRVRLFLIATLGVILGYVAVAWHAPHYIAPATGAIFGLIVQGIRHLRTIRIFQLRLGIAASRAVVFLLLVQVGQAVAASSDTPIPWAPGNQARANIQQQLAHTPGRHLVIIRYGRPHDIHDEWVYNGADIDGSKVVWAREVESDQTSKLLAYFRDRKVWLVEPVSSLGAEKLKPLELHPYSPLSSATSARNLNKTPRFHARLQPLTMETIRADVGASHVQIGHVRPHLRAKTLVSALALGHH